MASNTSQKTDDPDTNTTRPESDTDTEKYLEFGKHFYVSLLSKLTKEKALIGLVFIFICASVYLQNIAWAFLVVLCAISIAVLIEALDFVRRKLSAKSKEKKGQDIENQTLGSTKGDTKNVPEAEETNMEHGNEKQTDEDDTGARQMAMRASSAGTLTVHRRVKVDEKRYLNNDVQKRFNFIKENCSAEWRDLAVFLDFGHSEIHNIDKRNRDDKSRCMDMLQEWKKKNGDAATVEVLGQALADLLIAEAPADFKTRQVIICHTSEDKERFVQPLVTELIEQGIPVSARLYDDSTLYLMSGRPNLFVFVISNRVFDDPWGIRFLNDLLNKKRERIFHIWMGHDYEDLSALEEKLKAYSLSGSPPFVPDICMVDARIENGLPYIAAEVGRWFYIISGENKKDM